MTTLWFCLIVLLLVIIYDSYAIGTGKVPSISVTVIKYSKIYPIIPFAFGVVAGHFFWQL